MTVPASIQLKKKTGKPIVFTIHSTEEDRTVGIHPSSIIQDIEKLGTEEANQIITVSNRMKKQLIDRYSVDETKITVIHNGVDFQKFSGITKKSPNKIVLFLGRLTKQKGPTFFLQTAKKVLQIEPNVLFVVAGYGEQLQGLIKEAFDLEIMPSVVFTGYLSEEELLRAYEKASVYVMPSVEEPFGITALEAISSGTPVIVSKKAGVSETISNCFKIDFWDSTIMADRIIGILRYQVLAESMRRNAFNEIVDMSWEKVAEQTIDVYRRCL
jgi:glycosyltransferase involved in cell wall biosynthesis